MRGYLAVKVTKRQTTVAWVWDVFDQSEQRVLRISGEEIAKVRSRDAWAAADDAMLRRIASTSMEQLAAFLTAPEVAPGTAPSMDRAAGGDGGTRRSSPEAAGIFRVSRPDPIQPSAAPTPAPRPRSTSEQEAVTVAASAH